MKPPPFLDITCLEDDGRLRENATWMNAPAARRIPDPTTARTRKAHGGPRLQQTESSTALQFFALRQSFTFCSRPETGIVTIFAWLRLSAEPAAWEVLVAAPACPAICDALPWRSRCPRRGAWGASCFRYEADPRAEEGDLRSHLGRVSNGDQEESPGSAKRHPGWAAPP